MENDDYEYPYGDAQTHEALADLDRRLKALEPKPEKSPYDALHFDEPAAASEPANEPEVGPETADPYLGE